MYLFDARIISTARSFTISASLAKPSKLPFFRPPERPINTHTTPQRILPSDLASKVKFRLKWHSTTQIQPAFPNLTPLNEPLFNKKVKILSKLCHTPKPTHWAEHLIPLSPLWRATSGYTARAALLHPQATHEIYPIIMCPKNTKRGKPGLWAYSKGSTTST